jgi:hypothetical protein
MSTEPDLIPFDQGAEAYRRKEKFDVNPFPSDSWQHREWYDGWHNASECDPDESYDWIASKFKK